MSGEFQARLSDCSGAKIGTGAQDLGRLSQYGGNGSDSPVICYTYGPLSMGKR